MLHKLENFLDPPTAPQCYYQYPNTSFVQGLMMDPHCTLDLILAIDTRSPAFYTH